MREAGWGRVVLFGSEGAQQPYADELPHCASKAAIPNLSKGLSKTRARHGVLVNAVSPAVIATPMTDEMMRQRAEKNGTGLDEALASFLKEERPTLELQRRGTAREVAAAVVFLCPSTPASSTAPTCGSTVGPWRPFEVPFVTGAGTHQGSAARCGIER